MTLPAPGRTFDARPVLDDEFVAIAAADARLPARLAPTDLAALPVVLFESGANTRRLIDQWAARAGVTLKLVMELGNVEAIKNWSAPGSAAGWCRAWRCATPAAW